MTRRWWLLAAALLAIASAAAIGWLVSDGTIPSLVRNPLSDFVQPGIMVWWLVLGGPFRSAPSSPDGIAFAAAANAALWLAAAWPVLAIARVLRRLFAAPR